MRTYLFPLAALVAPTVLVHAQELAPVAQTVVSSVAGREGTLGAGTADGIRAGAVYDIVRNGRVVARARVSRVYSARSEVRFLDVADGFVVTVGDTARFAQMDTAPQVQPPVAAPTPSPMATPVAPAPVATVPAPAAPRMVAMSSSATPLVSFVNGDTVEIGAGSDSGLQAGKTVPIVRDGNVVALARIVTVSPASSMGTIVWRDETAGAIVAGDAIQVARGGNAAVDTGSDNVPAARVRFETGASNILVPKADPTYNYLASLAADKLILSQPAWVFHDDGTRRHRTDEDIRFTRAEIAGFVREALSNPKIEGAKTRNRVALSELISRYRTDLEKLGTSAEQLNAFGPRKGFEIGFSGQSRASVVGGDTNNYREAFSERNGSRRSRSGFDSRNNIFGRIGDRLRFDAQIDSGSDRRRGGGDKDFEIRRLVASYDAGNILRGLSVDLGRQEFWWGPGQFGTLLLSDNAGPLNSLRTVFKRGSYSVESLYSPLGTGPAGSGRSLYGQNLQVKLGNQTRIGIAATVLSPGRQLDPVLFASTFSPVPLVLAQRGAREETGADQTNLLTAAYFETGIARGLSGYGELLIDDLSFTNASPTRQRIGTLVGARLFKPGDPGKLGITAEYAQLEGRTYLRYRDPGALTQDYDYYYRGNSLGYPVSATPGLTPVGQTAGLGGASSLRSDAYWRPTRKLHLGAGLELADINSELAVLSRQQIYRFRAAYNVRHNYTVVARAQRISTTNPNFLIGPASRQSLYQLELVRTF
ncbi:MAG TPA: capsule assembly Wzi family protein [Abditibacteriaceae bacterium]